MIQVATLDSRHEGILIPRVRSQIFRHFLCSANTPSLPVLISSTDIRTPKVTQLTSTSSKSEIVWWIEGTRQQFRIFADVYVVPEPQNNLYSHFQKALAEARIGCGLFTLKNEDWEKRRVELFRSMSPALKASCCRPTRGAKLEGEAKKWPETIIEPDEQHMDKEEYETAKKLWEMALGNFTLMIVDPIEVDFFDSGVTPNFRSLFKLRVHSAVDSVEWVEEEIVP